ncbi:hypothetical protein HDV00_004198 [Rhizophlyctis rosea]|nr:hypothetical protein HDV00_004198 [Rhizophlyctis rosea]
MADNNSTNTQDRPTDQEILDYIKAMKEEEGISTAPLISEKTGFDALQAEYATGLQVFKDKINQIVETCTGMRTARKDGNCFYRAFSFRYCELLWENAGTPWADAIWQRAAVPEQILKEQNYDWTLLEDFWDVLKTAMTKQDDPAKLLEIFQTEHMTDGIVAWLRIITAAFLKENRDMYEAFILDSYPSLDEFIANQVEPMCVESDQIHIAAMANLLGVRIKVANLDPTETSVGLNYHDIEPMDPIPSNDQPSVVLLYRPGHYDVLYPKTS